MIGSIFAVVVCLVALVLPLTTGTIASAAPSASLADRVAAVLQKELPEINITVVDPLTIKVTRKDGASTQVNLDRIEAFCHADPPNCDAAVDGFAMKGVDVIRQFGTPPTKEKLFAAVRPADYAREMESLGSQIVASPLAGDLVLICYFDRPTAMEVATREAVAGLKLTVDEAIATCKANVHAALPPIDIALDKLQDRAFGHLNSDYESSRLIFHEDWAPIAEKLEGRLIVAVPASDTIVFGKEEDAAALDAMAALAAEMTRKAERPISESVFRWTPDGWQVAAP